MKPDHLQNVSNAHAVRPDNAHRTGSACIDACPKCGQKTVIPTTHAEEPDGEAHLKIQRGELIWIRISSVANPYGFAANRKCVCCEFEWRERF